MESTEEPSCIIENHICGGCAPIEMPEKNPFHWADWLIFTLFLLFSLGIGIYQSLFVKHEATTEDYHMGNRDFSIWPIALSMLSAFLSAILILGTPAEMYTAGTEYFVYVFGMVLACTFAALLFVPLLYPLKLTSSYEYLERRFQSKSAKITGSLILIVMQLLYMGICLYSPSTALEAVTGFPTSGAIVIGGAIAIIYVALGGLKASVWTSAFQAFVMALGVIAVIIKASIDLKGFDKIWEIADSTGRVEFFDFDPSPFTRHTFWTLVVGGTMGWLSTYGVNQASVQRFSAVPTLKYARLVVFLNIPGLFFMVTICCMAGVAMFSWYEYVGCDPYTAKLVENSNQILPYYVMDRLPIPGIPGLFLASLFAGALSTMSSSLGAVTAVTWEDMLKQFFTEWSDLRQTILNKIICVIYGIAAIGMAFMASNLGGTVLQASLSFTGAAGGPLLGLFFLGALFPCANWIGAVVGGVIGLAFPLWISFGAYNNVPVTNDTLPYSTINCDCWDINVTVQYPTGKTIDDMEGLEKMYQLSYLWYGSIGTATTVIIGLIVSFITGYTHPSDVDPKYHMPFFDRLICCLPDKALDTLRCHLPLYDPEEIRAHEIEDILQEDKDEEDEMKMTEVSDVENANRYVTPGDTKAKEALGNGVATQGMDNLGYTTSQFNKPVYEEVEKPELGFIYEKDQQMLTYF